jgi:nitrate reductase beta subunit
MTEPLIAHLRKLMAIADMADGHNDGKIEKPAAKEYMGALIARAEKLHCPKEVELLERINNAMQAIREDSFDAAKPRIYATSGMINSGLVKALSKSPEGRHLLSWKEALPHCPEMDYALPVHMQVKPSKAR